MNEFSFVKLKDIGEIVTGNTPKTSDSENYSSNDVPFLKPSDFGNDNITMARTECFVSNHAKNQARILPVDSVAVTCIGVIGKVLVTDIECAFNQQINAIIPKSCFLSRYIAYAIMFQREILQNRANAAVVPIINKSDFSNVQIPICSFEKQCEIVTVLDKLSTVINLRQKQLEKLDELVKSRFIELFGEPVVNPKGFPCYTVGEVIDFQGGSQPDKKYFEYEPSPDNIRLIQIRDYKSDKYITYIPKTMAKRFCTVDDIMIGRYGPPIFQILKGIEGSFNVALMKATPKMGNREFVRQFLKQDCLLEYLEGLSKRTAGQDGIQMDKLKAYPFPYPPIELQEQFAAFVEQTDKSKLAVQKSLEQLETLKKSLMQKYFG